MQLAIRSRVDPLALVTGRESACYLTVHRPRKWGERCQGRKNLHRDGLVG